MSPKLEEIKEVLEIIELKSNIKFHVTFEDFLEWVNDHLPVIISGYQAKNNITEDDPDFIMNLIKMVENGLYFFANKYSNFTTGFWEHVVYYLQEITSILLRENNINPNMFRCISFAGFITETLADKFDTLPDSL